MINMQVDMQQSMQTVFGGMGIGFVIMMFLVQGMILLTFGFVIFTIVKSIKREKQNDNSPKIAVPATVVAKRNRVGRNRGTSYFVTFQLENGERMELAVIGTEFGMLAEGDYGQLTFQGTRYLSFVRQ